MRSSGQPSICPRVLVVSFSSIRYLLRRMRLPPRKGAAVGVSWVRKRALRLHRVEELAHAGSHSLAAVAEADDFEAMHILVDLALAHDHQLLEALVHVLDAATGEDSDRFAGGGVRGQAGLLALAERAFLD